MHSDRGKAESVETVFIKYLYLFNNTWNILAIFFFLLKYLNNGLFISDLGNPDHSTAESKGSAENIFIQVL